jgi:hypothetical protein
VPAGGHAVLLQVLIICAWVVYLFGLLLLLIVLDKFRSRRTLLRLLLCMACLILSGAMLAVGESADVPEGLADTVLTRVIDTAGHWLSYALIGTAAAAFLTAAVRGLPVFRSR